jgi:hypothetical protein
MKVLNRQWHYYLTFFFKITLLFNLIITFTLLQFFLFSFFDMSTQEWRRVIQTRDLRFIKCGLQPIELPLRNFYNFHADSCRYMTCALWDYQLLSDNSIGSPSSWFVENVLLGVHLKKKKLFLNNSITRSSCHGGATRQWSSPSGGHNTVPFFFYYFNYLFSIHVISSPYT